MSFGGSVKTDNTATDAHARISREQFNIWQDKFAPLIDEAFVWLDDPGMMDRNIAQAKEAVNQAHDAGRGATARSMERYGVSARPQEQAAMDREASLDRALDLTRTSNDVRAVTDARRDAVERGLFGIGQGVAGSAQSGWGNVASMEATRNAANQQNAAATASSNISALGTVAGLGLTAAIAL